MSTVSSNSITNCRYRHECQARKPHINAAKASTIILGKRAYLTATKCDNTSIRRCLLLLLAAIDAISAIQSTNSLTSSSAQTKPKLKNIRNTIWATASSIKPPRRTTSAVFSSAVPQRSRRLARPAESDKTSYRSIRWPRNYRCGTR